MHFSQEGPVLRVVRITGPAHNLLGIEFAEGPADGGIVVEDLARAEPARAAAGGLDPAAVEREVRAGLDAARQEAGGRSLAVRRIQFVGTDPGPVSVYRELAVALLERHLRETG